LGPKSGVGTSGEPSKFSWIRSACDLGLQVVRGAVLLKLLIHAMAGGYRLNEVSVAYPCARPCVAGTTRASPKRYSMLLVSMTLVRRSTVAPCRTHCAFEMQSLAQLATEARSVAKLRHLELAASEWAQLQPWLPWLGTQSCARTLYCSLRQSSSAALGAAHEASRPRLALLSDAAVPLVSLRWNGGASVSMEARARHRLMGLRHWHFTPAAQATEQQSSKVLRPPDHASGPEAMNLTLTPRRERRSTIMLL
jgi:hypothetical protein